MSERFVLYMTSNKKLFKLEIMASEAFNQIKKVAKYYALVMS